MEVDELDEMRHLFGVIHNWKLKNLCQRERYSIVSKILQNTEKWLKKDIENKAPILVHKTCRRDFTYIKRNLKASKANTHSDESHALNLVI